MRWSASCCSARYRSTASWAVSKRSLRISSNDSASYQAGSKGQAVEDLFAWEENHAKEVGRRPADDQKVIINDLDATLEAHRAYKTTSAIRKIVPLRTPYSSIYRPVLQASPDDGKAQIQPLKLSHEIDRNSTESESDSGNLEEVAEDERPLWLVDSVEADKKHGNGFQKHHLKPSVKSEEISECEGIPLDPIKSWELTTVTDPFLERPWLVYMNKSKAEGMERFVSSQSLPCIEL